MGVRLPACVPHTPVPVPRATPARLPTAGLPHLRRSVDIAGTDATAPTTAGTGLKKEIRRSESIGS